MDATSDIRALADAAGRMLDEPVLALTPGGEGANSRIFRLDTPTRRLALKCYPVRPGDMRDRLEIEWRTLTFLRRHGIDAVPEPIALDRRRRLMAMAWLEGGLVREHTDADLDAAIAFMTGVFALSDVAGDEGFPPAAEACLSAGAILAQIDARLAMLPAASGDVGASLDATVSPSLIRARRSVAAEVTAGRELAADRRRLIAADFGFHNAIRQPDGRLRFFDLDYFGWDDPAKLAADFLLHPAMQLSAHDERRLTEGLAAALPADRDFTARLGRHLPLYGVRWALILFNPFRRDRLATLPPEPEARRRLLDDRVGKARRLLDAAERLAGVYA